MSKKWMAVKEAAADYSALATKPDVPLGYKRTDVGVIPEDWDVKLVGSICDFIVPGRNKPQVFNGDIPWITTPDIVNGRGVSESKTGLCVSRNEAKNVGSKIVPPGAVIMSCVGELGIVASVERSIVINQQLHAFIPTTAIDTTYLMYALQGQRDYMASIATQTAVPYLNKDSCNSIPIPLPAREEQRAIAAALSDVDALLAALDKLIVKKRAIKTAAMQQLLTGKQRLPGFEGEEWETKRLGDVAPLQRGYDLPISQLRLGPHPVVYSNGILNYHNSSMAKGPGVVTGRSGTIGKIHYVDQDYWPHNTSLWVTDFRGNGPKFIFYLYSLIGLERFGTGSGVPTLNRNDVHAFSVPIPVQVKEQTAIATILSDMDAEITALKARRDKTQAIKQGMMQELLTGRVRLVPARTGE